MKSRSPLYNTIIWLMYTLLGILIPIGFGSYLINAVAGLKLGDVTDGGQFGIYTAGMLIATLYMIVKPTKLQLQFPSTEWFAFFTVLGLVLSFLFFVLGTLFSKGIVTDSSWFRWPSVGLFVLSLVLAFRAVWLDNERMEQDPLAHRQQEQRTLEDEFDKGKIGDRSSF